jgi:hypothetical protein
MNYSSPSFVLHALPSCPPWLDRSNHTLWREQVMKLFIMLLSPDSLYLHSSSVPIFSSAPCPETTSVYVTRCQRPNFRPTQNHMQNSIPLYWIFIFLDGSWTLTQ